LTSSVIAALDFAVANRQRFNIKVVNMSLGHPILSPAADDPLVQAVESAVRAGLIVVVSAGNQGTKPRHRPGRLTRAWTSPGKRAVGHHRRRGQHEGNRDARRDEVSAYSSRGPTWYDGFVKPDVVAPGHSMISVTDVNSYLYKTYPNYDVKVNNRCTCD